MAIPVWLPRIQWGATYQYTIDLAYPFDDPRSWVEPRGTQLRQRVSSGQEAVWDDDLWDYFLQVQIRWVIPSSSISYGPAATGFNDANGLKDFLLWAWKGHDFRLVPDRVAAPNTYITSWLDKGMDAGAVGRETDETRKLSLTFRSTTEYTGY